jgi:hypothetical protein
MQKNVQIFRRVGRPRTWVSYYYHGNLYGSELLWVYRCPVVNGVPQLHLSWQHRVIVEP